MKSRSAAGAGPSQRQLKAGELIRHALVDVLAREELRDPALQGRSITVSEVRMSADLKHALAFAAPLGAADSTEKSAEMIAGLNRCAAFLRGKIARIVELRHVPDLKFVVDDSFAQAKRIDALLAQPDIARDLRPNPEAE